jgi:hypothetical protein
MVALLVVTGVDQASAAAVRHRPDVDGGYNNQQNPPPMAFAWTQLTPDGTQVRYATPEATCPALVETIGGHPERHRMVPEFQVGTYPVTATLCARRVDRNATAAQIDTNGVGVPVHPDPNGVVPIPDWTQQNPNKRRPANIALIGDTGCRIPRSGTMQTCDAQGWPLVQVAGNAATKAPRPDLVIHLGDYLYRTSPRRQPTSLCGGPAVGNNAHTWGCLVTDFFLPAEELLRQAPFVFVRGNHENCGRSGEVWFRYLANDVSTTACTTMNPHEDFSPPERIPAGTLTLINMDTSCASDEGQQQTCDRNARLATYTAQFNRINSNLGVGDNFLLSHTPLWAVYRRDANNDPVWIDELLEDAVRASTLQQLNTGINAVLSGHVHLFQALDFGNSPAEYRPPQLTVGASGTTLDPQNWRDADMINKTVDQLPLARLITRREWGYAVLHDGATTWQVRFFDQQGNPVSGTGCDLGTGQFVNCG